MQHYFVVRFKGSPLSSPKSVQARKTNIILKKQILKQTNPDIACKSHQHQFPSYLHSKIPYLSRSKRTYYLVTSNPLSRTNMNE